jgi:hypothetical protein
LASADFKSFQLASTEIQRISDILISTKYFTVHMPSVSADEIVSKLIKYSRLADQRTYLKDVEQKRVDEAFQLLTNGRPSANSKGAKHKTLYLEALRNIRRKLGDTGVVLCAAGAGSSAIANMTEEERVFLPSKVNERWSELHLDVFQKIADGVSKGNKTVCYLTSKTDIQHDRNTLNCS